MKDLTLEYIAGFVDGEGSFTIKKAGSGSYRAYFGIANTNLQILEDIQKFFSLGLKIKIKSRVNVNWKTCYDLEAKSRSQCKAIAKLLEPHLRLKKEQAQIIMQYPRAKPIWKGYHTVKDLSTSACMHKLYNRIHALNKTGPPGQEVKA